MNYLLKTGLAKIYVTIFMLYIAYLLVRPLSHFLAPFLDWNEWGETYYLLQSIKDNYINIWISLKITFIGTFVGCFLATLTAYPLAVYEFRFKITIMFLLVIIMMIPFIVNLIPMFLTLKLAEDYLSFIADIPVVSFFINRTLVTTVPFLIPAFGVFVIKQFIESVVNKEMLEAARIEGATERRIFFVLILPILFPVIAIIALIQFSGIWNSYELSLYFVGDESLRVLAHSVQSQPITIGAASPITFLNDILVFVPILFLASISGFIIKFINADLISQE
ncbi:MAG: carbohydrate ABC transporter permease [Saccharospirillaceae bacterium]|nr:ABC transporter permease subunit [Pseudomonadales bacterium]NRB78718.1 carbohydrate ABC transporter permease [Saccharospirillaceae bacterium]